MNELRSDPRFQASDVDGRLDIPTLIIGGDDDFVPREVVAHIADAIRGSRVEVLADCGHFAYLEHLQETGAIIAAFMTSP